jgi:hypothetical protein
MYIIMALEPISSAYFINSTHQPVCLCFLPVVGRHRLGKNLTAATNTQAACWRRHFSERSVPYQKKARYKLFPEFVINLIFLF